ncbi:hypothetical protein FB45DRAFT_1050507 [Roridomyces roridus]|uniref:F-box domain-containing protein n=1 Tax=Roridomyces roridus TaxID=1738132 RepID=A0AAD7CJN3_9AGAR|nr:hypothetical protein FB45DRAFT_1050507 [Roridomyces roridus]
MSLLQGVLRSRNQLPESRTSGSQSDESDDELVNVVSLPGTPARTRPPSPTRASASATSRPVPGPLHLSTRRDLLKALPTEITQRIFTKLSIKDLAKCALVSKKWSRSQTINYVWFQHYRHENFQDDSLPAGKWTKRESKQNWRVVHLQNASRRSDSVNGYSRASGYSSPTSLSGTQTPREIKEEMWRQEAEVTAPGKIEMRVMYKELGGRKSKAKSKWGSAGIRDKGGWADTDD